MSISTVVIVHCNLIMMGLNVAETTRFGISIDGRLLTKQDKK